MAQRRRSCWLLGCPRRPRPALLGAAAASARLAGNKHQKPLQNWGAMGGTLKRKRGAWGGGTLNSPGAVSSGDRRGRSRWVSRASETFSTQVPLQRRSHTSHRERGVCPGLNQCHGLLSTSRRGCPARFFHAQRQEPGTELRKIWGPQSTAGPGKAGETPKSSGHTWLLWVQGVLGVRSAKIPSAFDRLFSSTSGHTSPIQAPATRTAWGGTEDTDITRSSTSSHISAV